MDLMIYFFIHKQFFKGIEKAFYSKELFDRKSILVDTLKRKLFDFFSIAYLKHKEKLLF